MRLYKNRVDELTERLIQLKADSQMAAFYANESIRDILESYIEFLQYINSCNSPARIIHDHADKRLDKWVPVLENVKAKSAEFRELIQAQGLVVD